MGANLEQKAEITTPKELRKLIKKLFKHYRRREVYKDEFYDYFRAKGFTQEEIDELWYRAIGESGIVKCGVYFEADEIPPKKIIERHFLELIR